jgi:hypothetical protein
MAKFAFGAIFAPMQIGMAVAARYDCVASTKRKARLTVIKFDLALE